MNILIIGENACNNYISAFFRNNDINPIVLSDIFELHSLKGEVGNFIAQTKDDEIKADYIIITEARQDEASDEPSPCLEPIVFLLDYLSESPMAATIYALENAIRFARKKRQVYCLAKFIRTAGRGVEALYKEAREAGVSFIKYDNIQVSTDPEAGVFTVHVISNKKDGESAYFIHTKTLFSDSCDDFCDSTAHLVKVLNLSTNKFGYLTEDMHFLAPALTSRRGVFHLTRDLIAERLDEGLEFIYASMCLHDEQSLNTTSQNTAEIDGKKCVFCYNCYRTCPHAALEPDNKESQMKCLPVACEGCGICVGICPACAITLNGETWRQAPCRIHAICCENSALDTVKSVDGIECMVVPCGGIIDFERLSGGLTEYDKIVSIVCPDDACRHFDGNKRACVQTKRLHDMLEAAGLESHRVRVIQVSHAMPQIVLEELK